MTLPNGQVLARNGPVFRVRAGDDDNRHYGLSAQALEQVYSPSHVDIEWLSRLDKRHGRVALGRQMKYTVRLEGRYDLRQTPRVANIAMLEPAIRPRIRRFADTQSEHGAAGFHAVL